MQNVTIVFICVFENFLRVERQMSQLVKFRTNCFFKHLGDRNVSFQKTFEPYNSIGEKTVQFDREESRTVIIFHRSVL